MLYPSVLLNIHYNYISVNFLDILEINGQTVKSIGRTPVETEPRAGYTLGDLCLSRHINLSEPGDDRFGLHINFIL